MNKLENEKGKHRLIVLPIQPQSSNDFNGIGLALHFLLGNTIAVNTDLKEFWFGWRVKKLFSQEKDLKAFTHGQAKSLDLKRLTQEQGIRFWLSGQVDDHKTILSLYDGEEKGRPASTIISFSFDDYLIGFRNAFIHWLDGCGLPFSEPQKQLALWPEKMTWKGADIFGRTLEAFYIYSAYDDPNEGKIDLHPFKKVVAESPDSFMGQNLLGWACYRNKKYQNAKEAFLRALLANPDSPGVMSGLMWCGVYTKDEEEALYWASRKAVVMEKDIETARQKTLNRLKKVR